MGISSPSKRVVLDMTADKHRTGTPMPDGLLLLPKPRCFEDDDDEPLYYNLHISKPMTLQCELN